MGIIRRLILAGLAVYTAVVALTWGYVVTYDDPDQWDERDAIVVLSGDYLTRQTPGSQTDARVDRAIALMQSGRAPLMIMSGGTVLPGNPVVADYMRQRAITASISGAAILAETQSHSTLQNALFTAEILANNNLETIYLVTNRYHLLRSWASFRWAGITDIVLVAADPDGPILRQDLFKEGVKAPFNLVRAIAASLAAKFGASEQFVVDLLH